MISEAVNVRSKLSKVEIQPVDAQALTRNLLT